MTPRAATDVGYDRLAGIYRVIETIVFGGELQSARTALLDQLPPWRRLLILGDGDGRLLEEIAKRFDQDPTQSILSVDHSRAMLHRQRERLAKANRPRRIEWLSTDALHFAPAPGSFDVIVTAFFLDCFTEHQLLDSFPKWLAGLSNEGRWYHVDFVIPPQGWSRFRAKRLSDAMHIFFRATTGLPNRRLLDLPKFLDQLGLHKEVESVCYHQMIATQIYRLTNASHGSHGQPG